MGGWPLAIVGSLGYIAGQLPISIYLGPYLPDVIGSIVCFACLLLLLKVWRPAQTLGYGGVPVDGGAAGRGARATACPAGEVFQGWLPIIVLVVVVVAWTGPWSPLPASSGCISRSPPAPRSTPGSHDHRRLQLRRRSSAARAILVSWIIVRCCCGSPARSSARSSRRPGRRCGAPAWSACSSSAWPTSSTSPAWPARWPSAFSKIGAVLHRRGADPRLHRRRAVGQQHLDQRHVRQVPGAGRASCSASRCCCCRSLNSVGAEIGKPIAPQTASVGVSTSRVRAQRGRGDPPQFRLDPRAARLSRADRGGLLPVLPRHRGVAEGLTQRTANASGE